MTQKPFKNKLEKSCEKRGSSGNLTHKGTGSAVFSFERCFPWLPAAARVFPAASAASRRFPWASAVSRGFSWLVAASAVSQSFPPLPAAFRGSPRRLGLLAASRGFRSAVPRPRLPAALPQLLAASAVSCRLPQNNATKTLRKQLKQL